MGKLTHDGLERFMQDVLSKREPCPAMVLAWGWMLKQGEGGIFHNDTYKQRYFVLARVPHATVLIYYGQKCMDEDHILGYIDLRRVTTVRESTKMVALDNNRSTSSTLMTKLKGLMGSAPPPEGFPRPVLELVTSQRTYVLSPCTIIMPPPMTTGMSLGPSATGKPLYLFGWPFPVPPLDEEDDEADVTAQVAEGKFSTDAFAQWRDVMATAVAAEKATRVFPVMTLVDSSAQLPQRVLLRTTPCELAVISVDDKDCSFTAIPYNDLLKWEVQVDSELHLTARTRSRLVARPDRTGFASQRPTRPTCHYVFKSHAAKAIVGVVDGHLRALAKQLGSGEEGAGGGGGGDDEEDEYSAAARAAPGDGAGAYGGYDEDDSGGAAVKALAGRRPAPRPARDEGEEEEDARAPAGNGRAGAGRGAAAKPAAGGKAGARPAARTADSDEEEEEAPRKAAASSSSKAGAGKAKPAPAPVAKSSGGGSKRAVSAPDSEEEEEEDKPVARGSKKAAGVASGGSSKRSVAVEEDDEEEEEEAPKKKSSSGSRRSVEEVKPKKKTSSRSVEEEEEDEEPPARSSSGKGSKGGSSKKKAASEDEEEEEAPKPKARASPAKASSKKKVASDSEEDSD